MASKKSDYTLDQKRLIKALVGCFEANISEFRAFVEAVRVRIVETPALYALIHSLKVRVKEPSHLKDKLERKMEEAAKKGQQFEITEENLFQQINDLCGLRILHLHTRQFGEINQKLIGALDEGQFRIVEQPKAKTWDDETRNYFKSLPIDTEESPSMYTSVHYIIESNSRTKYTCEIQVRTLAEELWGEVSHSFTYPHKTESVACLEQINVLARATSSCSRLVDSIYKSLEEYNSFPKRRPKRENNDPPLVAGPEHPNIESPERPG